MSPVSLPQLHRQDLILVTGTLLLSRLLFYILWDQLDLVSFRRSIQAVAATLWNNLTEARLAIIGLFRRTFISFFGTTEVYLNMEDIRDILERKLVCGEGTNVSLSSVKIDYACLEVSGGSNTSSYRLLTQSTQCFTCPRTQTWAGNGLENVTQSFQVTTRYPTSLGVEKNGNQSCSVVSHFEQFGLYRIDLDTCDITTRDKPVNAFLPIFWAFVLLCLLAGCRLAYQSIYKTAVFRRFLVWITLRTRNEPEPVGDSALLLDENQLESRRPRRVVSLDAFRGLAITVMIFVNYGGGSYYFFSHSIWNGLTVADLVFPWFMWIMGVSLVISTQSQLRNSVPRKRLAIRVLRRSITLILLGLVINSDNHANDLSKLRIPGVLQRFGVSYLMVGLVECWKLPRQYSSSATPPLLLDVTSSPIQLMLALLCILLHSMATFFLPVPGCPTGYLGPGGLAENGTHYSCTGGAARYIDIRLFGENHIYQHPTSYKIYGGVSYDPEGLLGCLTSTALVFLGAAAGRVLLVYQDWKARSMRWMAWSLLLALASIALCGASLNSGPIPINKNLWSLSFILCTSAMAFSLLTLMYLLIDVYRFWSGSPFYYPGMNSILLYLGHEMCDGMFPWSWRPITQSHAELLAMNMWGCGLWILTSYVLYKKRIFLAL